MHFSKLFTIPLIAAASVSGLTIDNSVDAEMKRDLEKRNCYSSGVTYGNQIGLAIDAVDKACRNKLVHHYNGKTETSTCYDIGGGKRLNFNVRRWHKTGADLDFDTCKKYLRLEIVGCPRGGMSYQGNWRFMSDPNSGSC